jgi:hypothetical protein
MPVVVEAQGCATVFVGPVSTYFDVITSGDGFERLTDEKWTEMLKARDPAVKAPEWMREYRH